MESKYTRSEVCLADLITGHLSPTDQVDVSYAKECVQSKSCLRRLPLYYQRAASSSFVAVLVALVYICVYQVSKLFLHLVFAHVSPPLGSAP